jgi:hypothetical protein
LSEIIIPPVADKVLRFYFPAGEFAAACIVVEKTLLVSSSIIFPSPLFGFAHDNKVASGSCNLSFLSRCQRLLESMWRESLNATHLIMLYELPKIVVHQSIELASLYTQWEYDECGCVF